MAAPSSRKCFSVKNEDASKIIGKGGKKIKEIMSESGAHVTLDRNNTQERRQVVIRGEAAAVEKAEELILAITGGNQPSSSFGRGFSQENHGSDESSMRYGHIWGSSNSCQDGQNQYEDSQERQQNRVNDAHQKLARVNCPIPRENRSIYGENKEWEPSADLGCNEESWEENPYGSSWNSPQGAGPRAAAGSRGDSWRSSRSASSRPGGGETNGDAWHKVAGRGRGDQGGSSDWRGADGSRDVTCYKCNETGHMSRDCPNNRGTRSSNCYKCGETGHVSRDCPNRGSTKDVQCYKCNEMGHVSRDCPNNQTGRASKYSGSTKDVQCYKCNEMGHVSRDCPNSQTGRASKYSAPVHRKEDDDDEPINWSASCEDANMYAKTKWGSLDDIVKEFYVESPSVTALSQSEVEAIRREKKEITVEAKDMEVPKPVQTFEEAFHHYPEILEQIYNQNFHEPSPIQCQAWPVLMQGMNMIGIAQTGTGKTLAFLLPALIHIDGQTKPREERDGPTVLILSPTRELALQIQEEVDKINYKGIRSVCIYGGGSRREQIEMVTSGVEIVVATPGRLCDLTVNGHLKLRSVTYLVLDEADRMLDLGFEYDIRKIMLDIRSDRQMTMTSATWPPGVVSMAERYLKDAIKVNVGSLDLAAVHSVTQYVEVMEDEDKKARLFEIMGSLQPDDKIIVFCGRKAVADDVASDMALKDYACECMHGDREQSDRVSALSNFKSSETRILVSTDLAARGLDVKDVTLVINYDFPRNIEEYVHRIGRTGRAGRCGSSVTFMTYHDSRHASDLIKIMQEANQEVPPEVVRLAERRAARLERGDRGGRRGGYRGGF